MGFLIGILKVLFLVIMFPIWVLKELLKNI